MTSNFKIPIKRFFHIGWSRNANEEISPVFLDRNTPYLLKWLERESRLSFHLVPTISVFDQQFLCYTAWKDHWITFLLYCESIKWKQCLRFLKSLEQIQCLIRQNEKGCDLHSWLPWITRSLSYNFQNYFWTLEN